jgi:hypothetical protein
VAGEAVRADAREGAIKTGHKELKEASIATPPFRLATPAGDPFANAVPQRNPNDKSDCDFQHRDTGVEPLSLTIRDRQSNQNGGYRLLGWTCCCPCAAVSCSSAKRCQIWAIFTRVALPSSCWRVRATSKHSRARCRYSSALLATTRRPVYRDKRSWRRRRSKLGHSGRRTNRFQVANTGGGE